MKMAMMRFDEALKLQASSIQN